MGSRAKMETAARRCRDCVSWGTESCSEKAPDCVPADWPGCEHYYRAEENEAPTEIPKTPTVEVPRDLWEQCQTALWTAHFAVEELQDGSLGLPVTMVLAKLSLVLRGCSDAAQAVEAWEHAEAARKQTFGSPGVRDPDSPCAEYAPGEPDGQCESDGHYLCKECRRLVPPEVEP